MRQTNETATSFNQLKEITQAIQAQKNSVQTSGNANTSELTPKKALKPKGSAQDKKGALKPTKRAFSERQITTLRDKPQEALNNALKPNQAITKTTKGGNNEA
ncbi:hypothetical protein [Helicobacter pylori]|uniref:hypothetical protein n=1 Tax=Helicobacter pylori TaxID=210 RepID=UPI001E42C6FA|nr:hypothetical protein [Helicobacter pylori]